MNPIKILQNHTMKVHTPTSTSYSHIFSEMLLALTSFLPMQKTDLYPTDTVRLTVLRERSDVRQMDSLQTDNTQSSQMEQLTAMRHRLADRLECSADI